MLHLWPRLAFASLALLVWSSCAGDRYLGGAAGVDIPGVGGSDGLPAAGNGEASGPFSPISGPAALRKVKTLLTGGVPTAQERDAYANDPTELGRLVKSWMATDAFRRILQEFFTMQLQQGQTLAEDFSGIMYDATSVTPNANTMLGLRHSMGRTVLALIDEGRPFTEVMTTNRFMMTTEMMSYYAYTDTSVRADDGGFSNRWWKGDYNVGPTYRQAAGPVSLTDAATPSSPDYLTFYLPKLTQGYASMAPADAAKCASVDPLVVTDARTFSFHPAWAYHLWYIAHGTGNFDGYFWWSYPRQTVSPSVWCHLKVAGNANSFYLPSDANDWRMVTVRRPNADEPLTEFFDLERMRTSSTLVMAGERVGFFTTPAFLSQWGTNASNSSRAAVNQALIAALGHQIDGNDLLPLTTPTAVDPEHAAEPACFACHQTLDPLRQFLRQSYSLTYSPQKDVRQAALPATFVFRGHAVEGANGAMGLGQALATHPQLALAWTVKLCSWANSHPCDEADPEVRRIAALFVDSNYSFLTMAQALFTSPLVTYAAPTLTARDGGQLASIARRAQLCGVLAARLGAPDLCDLAHASPDGANTLPSRAAALPGDGYTRGVEAPLYMTEPEPFYVGNLENICALAAGLAIDGSTGFAASADPNAAVDKIVDRLMGVPSAEVATPTALLRAHVQGALAAGASAQVAVRSAFVAACTSGAVATVGQ